MADFALSVNGQKCRISARDPDMPLLYGLRNTLGLHGPKFGCGLGQCGACTVLIDGVAQRSCLVHIKDAAGRDVTTLEGLGSETKPGRVQRAFIAEAAAQCGYCTNGMIMTVHALLARTPHPTEAETRAELAGNLCRCGSHVRVLAAARRAAAEG